MSRSEFIIVTAIVLFLAFAAGWFAYWLLHRFTNITEADLNELDRMARALHDAEDTRDEAITYMQQREAELTKQLAQTEMELEAAMDGLQEARSEISYLRELVRERQA